MNMGKVHNYIYAYYTPDSPAAARRFYDFGTYGAHQLSIRMLHLAHAAPDLSGNGHLHPLKRSFTFVTSLTET
jgi:hypothetical protein